jgi:hypothetical protein
MSDSLEELRLIMDRLDSCVKVADHMAMCGSSKALVKRAAKLIGKAEMIIREMEWESGTLVLPSPLASCG